MTELVSVVMPVYNGEKYLKSSIESILRQSYTNLELVIVNDGSTDNSVNIIESFNDSRIKLFHNSSNSGLAVTQNKCIEHSMGAFIAKIDCDDIMLPHRLQYQYDYLKSNSDVAVIGSNVEVIDEFGEKTGQVWKYPAQKELIPSILYFGNYLTHPAVMIRRSALPSTYYRTAYNPAEDYDLWARISRSGYLIHNLPEILTLYRIHSQNISKTQKEVQINSKIRTIKNQFESIGIELSAEEIDIVARLKSQEISLANEINRLETILQKLESRVVSNSKLDPRALNKVCKVLYTKNALRNAKRLLKKQPLIVCSKYFSLMSLNRTKI